MTELGSVALNCEENAAGKALQEWGHPLGRGILGSRARPRRLGRKRQALLGPILRASEKPEPEVEPDWFQQARSRASLSAYKLQADKLAVDRRLLSYRSYIYIYVIVCHSHSSNTIRH